MNSKKIFESEDQKLNYTQTELTKYKDSVVTLVQKNNQLQYFSLESNDDALSYFDNLKINNLPNYITDQLISTNEKKGNNPLIPYESDGGAFKINKIKVLNHKWIIADFSDGEQWGELFLTYDIHDDKSVTFSVVKSFLYPINK
ncbi:hydrolase [Zhouia sp. PK063]